ncbi:DNA-binding protein [Cupriavidus sp. UYPR2.512]|uniref:DNA-binding protein n=1 Tax=Cupriavidus sp. UYPR2.512 TaxID=1080187 RepID=UPI0018DFB932|nr:DNA-binding protein [Cupriavidus sp. UYPR2.512]UIF85751.1 DNA-binding protein [Cupriavidus necator]
MATQEAVYSVAEALMLEGIEPTLTAVQGRTGGSYTTVKRHLEAWEAKRKGVIAAVDLPADVEARGREFVQALYAHALHDAKAAVAEPLALAEAARDKAEGRLAGAESEVARLEGIEQEQASRIDTLIQRVRELEMSTAAQQATIQEKALVAERLEAQLAEAHRALAARDQELAGLRASAKAVEGLQGQLDALQRTVQGLTATTGADASVAKGGKK